MAEEKVPTTPAAEQGIEGGKKKIAGKFDTIEQAFEEGYVGLERGYHAISENVSKLTKLVEAVITNPIGVNGQSDPYQRTGQQVVSDDIDPAKFLMNPGEYLQKRDEKLATRIVSQVVDLVGNMNAVNDFKSNNPDLVKHEKIVQAFLRDQDPRLPTNEKLAAAGNAAREYLKSLKVDLNAGNPNRAPKGEGYVEAPTPGTFQPGVTQIVSNDTEGEKELLNYIQERNKDMADHFGAPIPKK